MFIPRFTQCHICSLIIVAKLFVFVICIVYAVEKGLIAANWAPNGGAAAPHGSLCVESFRKAKVRQLDVAILA